MTQRQEPDRIGGEAGSGSADLLAAAWDATPLEAAVIDDDGRILAVNQAWRDFARDGQLRMHHAAVGADYIEITALGAEAGAPGAKEALDLLENALDGGDDDHDVVYPCSTPTGPRWFAVRVKGFFHWGRRVAIVLHAEITPRVVAEMEARARAREVEGFLDALRARNDDLESHGQMLEESLQAADLDQANRDLRALRGEVRRLARITRGLLVLSRVAQQEIKREPVDLSAIGRRVIERRVAAEPHRAVDARIEPGLTCVADATMAELLLEDLLGNAMKHTRDREDARIKVGHAEGRRFFVRDNGIGFDPSRAGDLFAPFHRSPESAAFEGTGVGLATVARIVERHGGHLHVEGRPGEGATFVFSLEPED